MALINKIREKSGIAVAVIAVALILFIVGGDFFSGNSSFGGLISGNDNRVGSINGEEVDYQQFVKLVDAQRQQLELSTGRSATESDIQNIRQQVWEQLVQERAFEPEYEALGIDVSAEELKEMIQGTKNMHPYIRQQFTDPNTGVFNEAQHREFINAAANKTLPAEQQYIWDNFKANLVKIRKSEKYQKAISGADYITKAEAKRAYKETNDRVSGEYLYVPFYSVADSLAKVTDSEVSDYYINHKAEFTPYDSRSFDYVVFQVVPSKEDSAALQQEINTVARAMASAENAEAYATANSDIRNPYLWSVGQLSDEVKQLLSGAIVGGSFGPIKDGQNYTIYKYEGTTNDTVPTMRASHILIRPDAADDASKLAARIRAQDLLNQIKGGADFEAMARVNGSDGTAQVGGDLGYFSKNGQMVKEFEDALFGFNGSGLIPNLVETDFGFHIVKVTEPKSSLKYKLAAITKVLEPSEATLNEAYQKAENLRASADDAEEFKKVVAENKDLVLLSAERIAPGSTSFNTIQNAREVVNWAYGNEVEMGTVSDRVFPIDNSFVIAALTAATNQESPVAADFKTQIENKVRNEKKGKIILDKIGSGKGSFEALAQKYGAGALVETVTDINLMTGMLNSAGLDAIAVGRLFGQKLNAVSNPFVGQNGVFVMKKTAETKAPEIADYSQFKAEIEQRRGMFAGAGMADQAVREAAKIVDRRAKLF